MVSVPTVSLSRPAAPAAAAQVPPRWLVPTLIVWCVVFGAACAIHANWEMLFGQGRLSVQGNDDTGYYLWLRSGVIDGDFDFTNDLQAAPTIHPTAKEQWLAQPRTPLGRVANKYPPGWALATLPAFLIGHGAALLLGAPADGWSPPYFVVLWLYHLGLAVLGLWLAHRVARRFVANEWALIGVLTLWLASPLVYYHAGRVSMAHGLLFTLVAAICHHTLALREQPAAGWRWWGLSSLCGLAVLTRYTAVCYLIFPAAVLLPVWWRLVGWKRVTTLVAVGIPAVAAAAIMIGSVWVQHGRLWVEPYATERFLWLHPQLWDVFFSPLHGLFYWHPLVLLGLAGAAIGACRGGLPRIWWATIAAISYLNASWHCWWFGSSFGNRAFEGVLLFAMVGLGWLLQHAAAGSRVRRAFSIGVLGVAVGAGTVLAVLFIARAISREAAVSYVDMLHGARGLLTGSSD